MRIRVLEFPCGWVGGKTKPEVTEGAPVCRLFSLAGDRLKKRFCEGSWRGYWFQDRNLWGNGRLGEAVELGRLGEAAELATLGMPFLFAILSVARFKYHPYLLGWAAPAASNQ